MVDKFPYAKDQARMKRLEEYYKIFQGLIYGDDNKEAVFQLKQYFQKSKKKRDILSISVNIGSLITTTFADFFVGEGFKIKHSDPSVEQELKELATREELNDKIYQSALSYSFCGFTSFEVSLDDGLSRINEIPFDNYYPDTNLPIGKESTKKIIASFFKDDTGNNQYMLKKIYTPGQIKKEVWLLDADEKESENKPFANFFTGEEEIETTGKKYIPIVQINNLKTVKEFFGGSDFKKVLGLLEEINDRFTQISLQFVKHLQAKIALPRGLATIDENGNLKSEDLEVLLMEAGESPPAYLEYKNPLIESAFEHIDKTIDKICAITQIPRELFGSDKGGVEKVEALRIRMLPFLKKIARAKRAFSTGIKKILFMAFEAEGKVLDLNKVEIRFDPGLPIDQVLQASAFETAVMSGFMSKRRAISEFNLLEGDELDKEIEQIASEEEINVTMPAGLI